jgi:hypothetical protein
VPEKLLHNAHVCEADQNRCVGVAEHMWIDAASDGRGRDIVSDVVEVADGQAAVCVHGLKQRRARRKRIVILAKESKVKFDRVPDGAGHVHKAASFGFGAALGKINSRGHGVTPKNGIDVQGNRLAGTKAALKHETNGKIVPRTAARKVRDQGRIFRIGQD